MTPNHCQPMLRGSHCSSRMYFVVEMVKVMMTVVGIGVLLPNN